MPKPEYPPEPRVCIEMPMDVARTLESILSQTEGCRGESYESHSSALYDEMFDVIVSGINSVRVAVSSSMTMAQLTPESKWRLDND